MTMQIHKECFPENGWKVLRSLSKVLKKYHCALAGGTALALTIGHRKSENLDFYTDTYFSPESLIADIRKTGRPFNIISEEDAYLFAEVDGIRFSLLEYDYPFVEEFSYIEDVQIAGVLDIATMKLMAISQNGTKGDFVDLYFVLNNVPFADIAGHMVKRFGSDIIASIDIGSALTNFSAADFNPEPRYTKGHKVSWDEVKGFLKENSGRFASDLKDLLSSVK